MWALILADVKETMKFVKRPKNCEMKVHFVFFFLFFFSYFSFPWKPRPEIVFFVILRKTGYQSSCTQYVKNSVVKSMDLIYYIDRVMVNLST